MCPKLILLILAAFFPLPTSLGSDHLVYLGCYLKDIEITGGGNDMSGTKTVLRGPLLLEPENSLKLQVLSWRLDLWFTPVEFVSSSSSEVEDCILACKRNSFRYAGLSKVFKHLSCSCGSSYGRYGSGQCDNCIGNFNEHEHCGSDNSSSIYDTGHKVPSPPEKLVLIQQTEHTLRIRWIEPLATNGPIIGYHIYANGIFSYSRSAVALQSKTWRADDMDREFLLTGLVPGTEYNISILATNSEGESLPVRLTAWSKIGAPDPPPSPTVIDQSANKMEIEFSSVRNTKGPLSSYRIAMIDESRPGFFSKERVSNWNYSMSIGYPQYIAAEFIPDKLPKNGRFVIGDGHTYGGYYNGPIPEGHWHPSLGIVSSLHGFTEISYSTTSHDQHQSIDNILQDTRKTLKDKQLRNGKKNTEPDQVEIVNGNSTIVTALWIAIAITAIILLLCVSIYSVLKFNLLPKTSRRRSSSALSTYQRPEQPTELKTCRSPSYIFPDEFPGGFNAGFVLDEDLKSRALERLKQVFYIPRNFIALPTDDEQVVRLVGNGIYGPVYLTSLKMNGIGSTVTLYTIPEAFFKSKESNNIMKVDDAETFISQLDELVKIQPHENLLKLIGFMEDGESLLFAVEFNGKSLKQWLLDFRDINKSSNDVCKTSYSFLVCMMNIAEAMFHLSSFKITHGELAAVNVQVTNLEVPKVTGFGALKMNCLKEERDFTRWNAVEQFQNRCAKPCDLWSFGILLWELSMLGGTPYYDIRSEDLQKRICRGSRPPQIEMIGDPLYQVMLHCWQLDRDERYDFGALSCAIHELLPRSKESLFISPSFNYPPYIYSYEHRK